jgi:G3E family GTPase
VSTEVTILGGFLGAGKTTALNHLLRAADDRVAVLVNDFGALNVDAALIEARQGGLIALTNGCVCCTIGADLSASLASLLARVPAPARIFVEASGVADPWRIAQLAQLEPGVTVEAVVVLVDATCFADLLEDRWLRDTLERQLARADVVALSKCDIASGAARAASRAAVERLRPGTPITEIADGALAGLLLATAAAPAPAASRFAAAPPSRFTSWLWRCEDPLDPERLHAALAALPAAVLRAKGFCTLGPAAAPHLLQLAGRRWRLTPWPDAAALGIVLIGTPDMPSPDWFGAWGADIACRAGAARHH